MRQRRRCFHVLVVVMCVLSFLAAVPQARATEAWEGKPGGSLTMLYADDREVQTYVAPPTQATELRAQAATITVAYEGFPPAAQASFQYAVQIWQSLLVAPLPIRVQAVWTELPTGVLGGARPEGFYVNTITKISYPVALAKQLMNRDPSPGEADIMAAFNSSGVTWYYGTGQTPPGQFNFTTVALHELGHGLGFTDSFGVTSGLGGWGSGGVPLIFDRFVVDASNTSLLTAARYPNPSIALTTGLQSDQLFFNGPKARAANAGKSARLYAPNPFEEGSSVSHLDEEVYPPGDPNSLMTPVGARGETNYNPGPITLGIFADHAGHLRRSGLGHRRRRPAAARPAAVRVPAALRPPAGRCQPLLQ